MSGAPRAMDDATQQLALRELGHALAIPSAATRTTAGGTDDLATRVRMRIVAEGIVPARRPWWHRIRSDRSRRSLVLAAMLAVAVAATAGAIGLGVPGIRILLAPFPSDAPGPTAGSPAPRPSGSVEPAAPGATLGLGTLVAAADVDRLTGPAALGFITRRPLDEAIGPFAATYLTAGRLSMVWTPGPTLPATETPSVGLVLTQFRGTVDPGFFGKIVGPGTTVDRVDVAGSAGYWVSGDLHFFFYSDPQGRIVEESRRFVGDTLVWTEGGVTYRLETATGLERALEIATSLR